MWTINLSWTPDNGLPRQEQFFSTAGEGSNLDAFMKRLVELGLADEITVVKRHTIGKVAIDRMGGR